MGRIRQVGRAGRSMDILARDNPAHALESFAGGDRCPMGKARLTSARPGREHAAKSQEAELLLRSHSFSRARHAAVTGNERRARDLSVQLQSLSRFLERDDDRQSDRCDRKDGRSRRNTESGVWKVFEETTVATRHLSFRPRRRYLPRHRCQVPESFRRCRIPSSHARPRPAPCGAIRRLA